MKQFTLKKCDDKIIWNNFVRNSITNSIFSESHFLDLLGVDYQLYFVIKKSNPVLGCIIFKRPNLTDDIPYTRQMHHGLVVPKFTNKSHHSITCLVNDATRFLLENLIVKMNNLVFCQHPQINDTRAFKWFVDDNALPLFINQEVLHTAIIDLKMYNSFEEYFEKLPSPRKAEYKKCKKSDLTLKIDHSVDDFICLFRETFEVQNIQLNSDYIETVNRVVRGVIANGTGRLEALYDQKNNIVNATVFVDDGSTSFYLHGASNRNRNNCGGGTFLILNQLQNCFQKNISNVNLLGVNSPARGFFKTSFNAVVEQFVDITINK